MSSLPNSWRDILLKWGFKIFLNSEMLEFEVLTSINVPPLKSIPKLRPLINKSKIEKIGASVYSIKELD